MENTTEPISVAILDHEYQFTCQPQERQALHDAALYLDERMRSVKGAGRLMTLERIAVMTALNLASELLKLEKHEQHRVDTVDNRIRMLADELDDALERQLG